MIKQIAMANLNIKHFSKKRRRKRSKPGSTPIKLSINQNGNPGINYRQMKDYEKETKRKEKCLNSAEMNISLKKNNIREVKRELIIIGEINSKWMMNINQKKIKFKSTLNNLIYQMHRMTKN